MTIPEAREILEVVNGFRQMYLSLDHHQDPSPLRTKILGDLKMQSLHLSAAGGPDAVAEALTLLAAEIPNA
jgi:hypothetical protein